MRDVGTEEDDAPSSIADQYRSYQSVSSPSLPPPYALPTPMCFLFVACIRVQWMAVLEYLRGDSEGSKATLAKDTLRTVESVTGDMGHGGRGHALPSPLPCVSYHSVAMCLVR